STPACPSTRWRTCPSIIACRWRRWGRCWLAWFRNRSPRRGPRPCPTRWNKKRTWPNLTWQRCKARTAPARRRPSAVRTAAAARFREQVKVAEHHALTIRQVLLSYKVVAPPDSAEQKLDGEGRPAPAPSPSEG